MLNSSSRLQTSALHSSPLPVAKQADGFTYERSAIEQWLENHNTSPKTGVELESKQLVPNYSLRSLIQDFHERGGRA